MAIAFAGFSCVRCILFSNRRARRRKPRSTPRGKRAWPRLQEEQDAQAGTAIFIVFDDSGSMNDDNKLVMAKKSFRAWIEHAPDDYRFSLTAINAGPLVQLARHNRAQVLAAVDKLRASGNTPLADTIARVHDAIARYRASGALYVREIVVILTDGEDNTARGDEGVRYEMNRLRSESVEVIAFGYKGEADYLNGAATHFYSPNNGQDISKGLNAISAEVRDTSDVAVDDATRRLMASLPVVASMQSAPVVTPTPSPTAAPAVVARKSRRLRLENRLPGDRRLPGAQRNFQRRQKGEITGDEKNGFGPAHPVDAGDGRLGPVASVARRAAQRRPVRAHERFAPVQAHGHVLRRRLARLPRAAFAAFRARAGRPRHRRALGDGAGL